VVPWSRRLACARPFLSVAELSAGSAML